MADISECNLVNETNLVHELFLVYFVNFVFNLYMFQDLSRSIIGRNKYIYATLGTCYSVQLAVWCCRVEFHPAYQLFLLMIDLERPETC